jgi:hypothetical protein
MDRGSHLVFAMAKQAGVAHLAGLSPAQTVTSVVVAGLASWGPDVDQLAGWKAIDRPIPDEELGHGGPLKHRGITHFWLWPVLAAASAHTADLGDAGWVIWALILGWTSHLLGDFIFGERPKGIPLAPWWAYIGLGLNSGGRIERWLFVPAFALGTLWWVTGWPGADYVTQALAR